MPPLLSVVVPAFNVSAFIVEAVASVQAQSMDDLEIIVIDDGSTDGTAAAVRHLTRDARVRLLDNSSGVRGPSGARNTGLNVAAGKYIGFLDADDAWHPDKARRHIELLDGDPGIDLTFSRWRVIDDVGRETGRVSRAPRTRNVDVEDLLKENLVGGASNVICRRTAIERAGPFDPSLSAAVDLDLWLRIARSRPRNIAFVDAVLTTYRLRAGQITKDWRRMAENWEVVLARVRSEMPERVSLVEQEARARHLRYRSYLAYEAGDFHAARRLIVEALTTKPLPLLTDRRTWVTLGAALGSLLPAPVHAKVADSAKRLRAAVFARRSA